MVSHSLLWYNHYGSPAYSFLLCESFFLHSLTVDETGLLSAAQHPRRPKTVTGGFWPSAKAAAHPSLGRLHSAQGGTPLGLFPAREIFAAGIRFPAPSGKLPHHIIEVFPQGKLPQRGLCTPPTNPKTETAGLLGEYLDPKGQRLPALGPPSGAHSPRFFQSAVFRPCAKPGRKTSTS